jgi:FemAB-related protein (PEP-CTERM system-associated)
MNKASGKPPPNLHLFMDIRVRSLQPEDRPQWDAFVREHPQGSPFHLIAWKSSIEEVFRYEPHYLVAVSGDRVRGVLPLFLVQNFLMGKVLLSTPFAVYGGILADSPEARDALRDAVDRLSREMNVDYSELRNAHPEQCAGFSPVSRYACFVQEIGPDEEALLNGIPRKTRAMVRKAFKFSLSMEQASNPDTFIDLYTRNLRRLGTPSFPERHFHALLRNFGKEADVREVRMNGKALSAVLTFYFRDWVLPYYGASDPAYNEYAPNNYMYFDLMRWGGQNGYRWFDFGRSKKDSGSFDFKAHWGMEVRDLPYEMLLVKRKELPNFSPKNPKFQSAIQLWQKTPLFVTKAIGPMLIRLVP